MTLGKVPLRGLLIYVEKKMPLIRTYVHSYRKSPLRELLMYMKNNASS